MNPNLPHLIVYPDFCRDDFRQLYNYVLRMDFFRPVYTVLTPLPGTTWYEENHERLYLKVRHSCKIEPLVWSRFRFFREDIRLLTFCATGKILA